MNFYRFEVERNLHFNKGTEILKGFLKASDYTDATFQITDSFKDDLVSINKLYKTGLGDLLFDDEIKEWGREV